MLLRRYKAILLGRFSFYRFFFLPSSMWCDFQPFLHYFLYTQWCYVYTNTCRNRFYQIVHNITVYTVSFNFFFLSLCMCLCVYLRVLPRHSPIFIFLASTLYASYSFRWSATIHLIISFACLYIQWFFSLRWIIIMKTAVTQLMWENSTSSHFVGCVRRRRDFPLFHIVKQSDDFQYYMPLRILCTGDILVFLFFRRLNSNGSQFSFIEFLLVFNFTPSHTQHTRTQTTRCVHSCALCSPVSFSQLFRH